MKKSIGLVFLTFVFLTVLLSGCAPASTPVPPTPTSVPPTATPTKKPTSTHIPPTPTVAPPSLKGRLLVQDRESNFYIVTPNTTDSGYSISKISRGKIRYDFEMGGDIYALSPNRNYLLYSTVDGQFAETILYDLQGGNETSILTGVKCLSWSTDSARFSYVDSEAGLYIYELSGRNSLFVASAPSANYYGSGTSGIVYAPIECGSWFNPKHLIFPRYLGEMPETIFKDGIHTNTLTSFVIGGSPESVDSTKPEWVTIQDVATDGEAVLLRHGDSKVA